MMTKAALRAILREKRRAFVAASGPELILAMNAAVTAAILSHLLSPNGDHPEPVEGCWAVARQSFDKLSLSAGDGKVAVAAYLTDGLEVDPLGILIAAGALGHITALPHVTARDAPMRFLRWSPGDPLVAGPMRLRQPAADALELAPDIILTPLVGFDRTLARLGQGGGFYDRAFAAYPHACRVGLAWDVQEADIVPVDPWDMPLHAIATETRWICRGT